MDGFSAIRSSAASLIRKHRWIPPAAVSVFATAFVVAAIYSAHLLWTLGSCVGLLLATYVWGYWTRALAVIQYPALLNLRRRQYDQVWDALAASSELARAAACGHVDESELRRSAQIPVRNLMELAGVSSNDDILEFGCGVARIGLELAPRCRSWTGADLSAKMLATAAERLQGVANTRLVKLQQVGLDQLGSDSFDLVYSTNMLAHLDQQDRWRL